MELGSIIENIGSSPARGTWIEINRGHGVEKQMQVVPRKGDVDRNKEALAARIQQEVSSPARGTWIEICQCLPTGTARRVVPRKGDVDRNKRAVVQPVGVERVVPRKGDVDRNLCPATRKTAWRCRPPQGGRG